MLEIKANIYTMENKYSPLKSLVALSPDGLKHWLSTMDSFV